MKKSLYFIPLFILLWGISTLTSCKKDILLSKEYIEFSTDTVLFDTVFTTVGSTTKRLKIYNKANKPVKVSKIRLEGGTNSPYRINLDGASGTVFNDITIPAKDSLFMFVEVTLGENNQNDPFIIMDSVLFETNGKDQYVQLAAWGQDAHFYNNDSVDGIWTADKPHVIYNLAVVDTSKTLIIEAGTQIYLHKNAILYVNLGTLIVDGTYENKVVFQGDRLEQFYQDVKGQYYGIYFNQAKSSTINNAIIKNGTAGIHVFDDNQDNTDYTLTITNSEIFNHSSYGLFNYSGGRVYGENLNVHNNGVYAFLQLEGGDYNFRHCQFLSWGSDGNQPAVAIKNYFTRSDGITYIGSIHEGAIYNSILYGGGDYQLGYDTLNQDGMATINYDLNTNFIKQKDYPTDNPHFVNITWNSDPKFESIEEKNFKIRANSPCIEAGSSAFAVPFDIEGNSRNMAQPDIGAYERD